MMAIMAEPLVALSSGQAQAIMDFGSWMVSEQRRIFLLCVRMLQDGDEADTATQDTFLKAYRALQKPGSAVIEDYDKWLTRIALNTCLDRLRSRSLRFWRRRTQAEDEETILSRAANTAPDAERRLYAGQIARRLAEAVNRLSHRQRAVFTLKHYEDRSLEEIAEILQLELGTVKAHMARALAHLRKDLRDLYQMGPGEEPR